ncbi:HSP20-like chaperone [Stereum hirsutum FP-91666 SS1]|uniref:HSP20-like chaperone n=1 Tax=Stereum hirsutum (strain FP-91666) TaxID=721885 RepID=R7RZT0_STEHR|nr:HSP20-like chaperone [Stereum hirsutum FP-91666 SS1]EIM80410.1 HSP20-like chaperone [Stereum hirsutum FP-91666 SS1]
MSFNDTFFRPFFQLLDEPYTQQSPSGTVSRRNPTTNFFDDPFFNATRRLRSPAVEINEEGDHYVVEAELPGVRKEDVDVRIGDAGRSLTIEGKSFRKFGRGAEPASGQNSTNTPSTPAEATPKDQSNTVANKPTNADQQVSTRNDFVGTSSSSFSRTVWLPRPVDAKNVSANLDHGVLTLRIPKAAEGTTRIPIL